MAEEDEKGIKEPFNENANRTEYTITFQPEPEPEHLDEFRSNTDIRHEPKSLPNTQNTPSGTKVFYSRPQQKEQAQKRPRQQTNEEIQYELLNGDYTVETEINGYKVRAKVTDHPSKEGLNGGRISRLVLSTGDRGKEAEHARFDHGAWKKEMTTGLERQTAMEVIHDHDSDSLKKRHSASESKDKNKDHAQDKGGDKSNGHTR